MLRAMSPFIIVVFALLLDWYVFQGYRAAMQPLGHRYRWGMHTFYWGMTLIFLATIGSAYFILPWKRWPVTVKTYLLPFLFGWFIAKLIASVFFMADDLRRMLQWTGSGISRLVQKGEPSVGMPVSRSLFLSWLGVGMGGGVFGSLLWGMANRYRYRTVKVDVRFPHLPKPFRGMRIVHISDIHSGSFTDKRSVEKGVQRILDLKPDLICFTGDLVNDSADEMDGYKDVFSRLKAPMGVYSCLGNHDYGDYRGWEDAQAKADNLQRLKDTHAEMGWRLLVNEHVVLEREGERIALLGIENWGAKANFQKYGRMDLAHAGTDAYPFRILLSHDPSHWEAQVLPEYPDIDLMLSGHTHGMQFGVEMPGFRWSPIQYVYRQWAGLYQAEGRYLYVNRGFGYLGYPGRVGILPEITLLELS